MLFSSANDSEEDGMAEFRACIKVLADKVCILSRQRAELLDRYSKAEAANRRLTEELEERKELVKTLYTKHQLEKQVILPPVAGCEYVVCAPFARLGVKKLV